MVKIQDLAFGIMFLIAVWLRRARLVTCLGLGSLLLAMPLFALRRGLFTAERLTWYAAGFFLLAIIFLTFKKRERKRSA